MTRTGARGDRRRRFFIDATPLRESRDYRRLFGAMLVSSTGTHMTRPAVLVQVYVLSGESNLAVGLVGLCDLVPLILGSIVGGALADAHDRRRLLLLSQASLGLISACLALNAFLDTPLLWPIYVLTACQAAFTGLDMPTRSAIIPTVVRRDLLSSALALNQLLWQVSQVVGPLVAALLISRWSVSAVYLADAGTFVVGIMVLLGVRPLRPEGGGTPVSWASIVEGLRYVRRQRAVLGTFVIDINAMVFGMPRALFPALAVQFFGTPDDAGYFFSAVAAGALAAAAGSGWLTRVERQGRVVIIAVVAWGFAIAAFGLVPWAWLALVLLAVAGAADVVSAVFRSSILQLTVPDRLRGRMSASFIAVVAGGPDLGDVESGSVAAVAGPQVAVVSGGLACVAGAGLVARLIPELAHWDRRQHRHEADDEQNPAAAEPG